MPRKKSNKFIECFKIFFSSIKTYFIYFDECIKALAFPVFGQVLSVILIFTVVYYFSTNVDKIRSIGSFFDNDSNLLILLGIIILPLMIVLVKAVFDYIIAFASLNLLFYTASKKKKSKTIDLTANNNVIKRRLFQYVLLILIVNLLLVFPPLWIFLCLSFQVFALEGEVSAIKSIERSCQLAIDNIVVVILMLLLCALSTYMFLPNMFIWFADKIGISSFLINLWEDFFALLPIDNWNNMVSVLDSVSPGLSSNFSINVVTLSKCAVECVIMFIIIGFTLPFRCSCFTELYKLFDSEKIKEISKCSEDIISRATKKGKN